MPAMDSSTTTTGYKGTARPAVSRPGFTARRGGHNSNTRHSRQPKKSIAIPSSNSNSDFETEEDVRQPTQRKEILASFADKENRHSGKDAHIQAKVTSAKSLGKKLDSQQQLINELPRKSSTTSPDEHVQQSQPTTVCETNDTITSNDFQVRLADNQSTSSTIDDVDSERKMMARSIIAGFPRRALESLLLDASMSSPSVMREVIGWNAKNPIDDGETITFQTNQVMRELVPSPIQGEDSNFAVMAYSGLPATRAVWPISVAKSKPVTITKSTKTSAPRVPSQETNTDKKIERLLEAAKRRRKRGEEYIPPATEDRSKRLKTSPSSPPPEPRSKLEQPLSFLTKDMTHIPLIDIEAYVNRPISERQLESENNKVPGKVKRPMNSFMLYRKAYQHRAKEYGFMTNHQVVSQLCGDSWPLEPEELKEQFAEWARIERNKHEEAHPGYKFCPRPSGESSLLDELMD